MGCEPVGNQRLLWGCLIVTDEMQIGTISTLHRAEPPGWTTWSCTFQVTSTKDPMNLSQRRQRENSSKKNNGPHESCWVFAVSFTQKSEAATFPRISVRQISQNVRWLAENTAGFSSGRYPGLRRPFPPIPILPDGPRFTVTSSETLLILSGRCHHNSVIRSMDFGPSLLPFNYVTLCKWSNLSVPNL